MSGSLRLRQHHAGRLFALKPPANTRKAWDLMRTSPGRPETPRHSRLRGDLATAIYGGRELEQWEIEVTGAGRIFYLLDKDKRAVRITKAETGHPKVTE